MKADTVIFFNLGQQVQLLYKEVKRGLNLYKFIKKNDKYRKTKLIFICESLPVSYNRLGIND